jgi:hypothetical protein
LYRWAGKTSKLDNREKNMSERNGITKMQVITSSNPLSAGSDDYYMVKVWHGQTDTEHRDCSVELYSQAMDYGASAQYHDVETIDETEFGGGIVVIDSFEF